MKTSVEAWTEKYDEICAIISPDYRLNLPVKIIDKIDLF